MPKLAGQCSLCGAKRSSANWRYLPLCAGPRAGEEACNACFVSVARQAREDEAGVPEVLEARCALRGAPLGQLQQHLRAASKALSSSPPPAQEEGGMEEPGKLQQRVQQARQAQQAQQAQQQEAGTSRPSQGQQEGQPEQLEGSGGPALPRGPSGSADLLDLLGSPGEAVAPSVTGTPGSSPAKAHRSVSVGDSCAGGVACSHKVGPTAEGPPPQWTATSPPQQQAARGPAAAASVALHASGLPARRLADDLVRLKQACFMLAGDQQPVAQLAWRDAQRDPRDMDQLATLPLLQLVLPGVGCPLQPVGTLLICMNPGPRPVDPSAQSQPRGAWPGSRSLRVAVYCPRSGELVLHRDGVTVDEARLYRHPRHRKWAWDSSEGWELLFPEAGEEGPANQIRLFLSIVSFFPRASGAPPVPPTSFVVNRPMQQPAGGPSLQPHPAQPGPVLVATVQQRQQQPQQPPPQPAQPPPPQPHHAMLVPAHMLPPPPMHPLVLPQQQPSALWQGQQQHPPVLPLMGPSSFQAPTAQPPSSSQWPGSPQAVGMPSSGLMQQLYVPVAQPSMPSPAAQQGAPAASHPHSGGSYAAAAPAPWQSGAGSQLHLLAMHRTPMQGQQQLPVHPARVQQSVQPARVQQSVQLAVGMAQQQMQPQLRQPPIGMQPTPQAGTGLASAAVAPTAQQAQVHQHRQQFNEMAAPPLPSAVAAGIEDLLDSW